MHDWKLSLKKTETNVEHLYKFKLVMHLFQILLKLEMAFTNTKENSERNIKVINSGSMAKISLTMIFSFIRKKELC